MNLDVRLSMVAGLVRQGMPLADIGTDHAYLPVYLVENGIIPYAVAGDVRSGPLENAKKTIMKYGLEDKITTVLSDGLRDIPHDYTDFCMAGMGGELIAKILEESPWVQVPGNHFVFQPQTHPEDLRRYCFENRFEILKEDVVKDGRRYYHAMEVVFSGEIKEYAATDLYCFIGKLKESDSVYKKEYLKWVASRLEVKYRATGNLDMKPIIDGILEAAQ